MSTNSLRPVREAAATHLAEELGDSALAKELAEIIGADALQWRPAVVDKRAVKTIVAYSFGNRMMSTAIDRRDRSTQPLLILRSACTPRLRLPSMRSGRSRMQLGAAFPQAA